MSQLAVIVVHEIFLDDSVAEAEAAFEDVLGVGRSHPINGADSGAIQVAYTFGSVPVLILEWLQNRLLHVIQRCVFEVRQSTQKLLEPFFLEASQCLEHELHYTRYLQCVLPGDRGVVWAALPLQVLPVLVGGRLASVGQRVKGRIPHLSELELAKKYGGTTPRRHDDK